jgi:hypothetical protein
MQLNLDFKNWLVPEMGATAAVFDPSQKSRDWNWEGSPGTSCGVSPKENPIGIKNKKKIRK